MQCVWWLTVETRCVLQYFVKARMALWTGSECLVVFVDERLTWYGAANKCLDRGGRLATLDLLNTTTVRAIVPTRITTRCHWLGLVKQYLYWTVPDSK